MTPVVLWFHCNCKALCQRTIGQPLTSARLSQRDPVHDAAVAFPMHSKFLCMPSHRLQLHATCDAIKKVDLQVSRSRDQISVKRARTKSRCQDTLQQ